ncbi:hypothetical protein LNKW23_10080 [Paralimibaculum aggregatum]|uniref:PEP-CTERM sorting domain-containing protein n=1 Tax=Paralimibaculum aggregatum TaxID=3036245 RepID=A0ABQ6LEM5_9RHOB|nr:hypothetical protein [Limibaculum sp. NKW23]GMG81795.1 hypothetical protein LNKW23_10080 [Limibaculum sp. NKW23]
MPTRPAIRAAALALSALVLPALLLPAPAGAAPVAVLNPGFEAEVHGPNSFTFGPPTGWDGYNLDAVTGETVGTLNPALSSYFAPGQHAGANVGIAYMDAGGTAGVAFGLQQTLAAVLEADRLYRLSVAIGNIASGSSDLGGGPVFFDLDGFPGYRVELLAGTTVLASDDNGLAGSIPEAEFRPSVLAYDSRGAAPGLLGQALTIRLVNLNLVDAAAPGAHREVDFDAVALDAVAVPLPAPLGLAVLGLAALAALAGLGMRRAAG